MQEKIERTPRVSHVNWFARIRKKIIWPGYGEHRVLKWIVDRARVGPVKKETTRIG